MLRSFRYPLKPTVAQASILETWLTRCRWLYNGALEERISSWKLLKKTITRYDQQKSLTVIRSEDPDFAAVPATILRSSLKRLDSAYQSFFRRVKKGETAGFPRFKNKDRFDSFSLQRATRIEHRIKGKSQARVWIPTLGWVSFHEYRPIRGEILDVTFRREPDGQWFVGFQCDRGTAPPTITEPKNPIGIDLGLTHLAILSTGETIANPRFFRRGEEVLAGRQRALARKRKGSRSRRKAKILVLRAHRKIKNQRLDHARKVAKDLVSRYDMIAHEDLAIRNMVKGRLSKSIHDASWAQLIQCLISKAEEAGRLVVGVDPRGTTQRCSGCGERVPKGLADRTHDCKSCGLVLDRDHNAALNILALGFSAVNPGQVREHPSSTPKLEMAVI